jgi:hypothetical protein
MAAGQWHPALRFRLGTFFNAAGTAASALASLHGAADVRLAVWFDR